MIQSQMIISIVAISVYLLNSVNAYLTAAPVWLTSDFFRAGNQNVINRLTGSNQTPQFTFIFSSRLPGIPKLAYGIKNYRGNDYFGIQTFEVRRVDLTPTSFKVAVQIYGTTNIWILNVPYIAIDPQFPHHLNSFDNVPVNYSAGALTNITNKSMMLQTYTNVVNYTQQCAGLNYNRFKSPISNNRILFYIMALNIRSTNQNSLPWYPIDFHIRLTVLTEQTYQIYVSLKINVLIDYLHLSQIMFDQADVQSSKTYYIVTQYYDMPQQGGFIPIPEKFVDNFIMGLTDFSTIKGKSVLNYNWEFETINGVFGVKVNQSIPVPGIDQYALTRQGTMVFYIKTWMCPDGYDYFNLTTNQCQDMCGDYHFEDENIKQCQYCNYSCLDCTSGHDCLACSGGNDNRVLTGQKACLCIPGYYQEQQQTTCKPCQNLLPNCIDCFYNNTFDQADSSTGALHYGCFECSEETFLQDFHCRSYSNCETGKFLIKETNECIQCQLDGCLTCSSLIECSQCDELNNKFLNSQTKLCESCTTLFCQVCINSQECSQCKDTFVLLYNYCICPNHHYLDLDDQRCLSCSPYCKTCSGETPYDCQSCYFDQNRVLIGGVCVCDSHNYQEPQPGAESRDCVQIDNSKCDRGFIFLRQDNRCIQLCGDGILIGYQCDDGNIQNGDGCSDSCQIQESFVCTQEIGQISTCRLQGTVTIEEMVIVKQAGSNKLEITMQLQPKASIYDEYNYLQILEFSGADIDIVQYRIQDGKLILFAEYYEDLSDKKVALNIKSEHYFNKSINQYPETIFTTEKATFNFSAPKLINNIDIVPTQQDQFVIKTSNNLQPHYFTQEQYEYYTISNSIVTAATVLSLATVFISLFMKSSFSTLIIVSALQVTVIGVTTIDGLNPLSSALIESKPLLGLNNSPIPDNTEPIIQQKLHNRMEVMGFSQDFSNNFNIMLYCCCGLLCINIFFYLASMKKVSMKIGFRVMQRQTMLFIFFNATNAYFCLSILKKVTLLNISLAVITIGVLGYQSIHFLLKAQQYFGMKQTINFKQSYFKLFLIVFLLERFLIGLLLGLIEDPFYAAISGIACQVIFAIFVMILRPFILLLTNIMIGIGQILGASFFVAVITKSGEKQSDIVSAGIMVGTVFGIAIIQVVNLIYSLVNDVISRRSTYQTK